MLCAQKIYDYQQKIFMVVIMFFTLSGSGCNDKKAEESHSLPLVRTYRITTDFSDNKETFTGIVVAKTQSNLSFRVAGKVIEKYVDVGQGVQKGQVLARIDDTDLLSRLRTSKEAVLSARAELHKVLNNEKRFSSLVSTGAVSKVEYDAAKAQADIARSTLRSAEAQQNIASNETRYAKLIADADGVITNTFIETGEYVSAGQIAIQLAHRGAREAKISLPESQRPAIGSRAMAHLYSNNETTEATLRLLSQAADPATRTYNAHYTLGNVSPPLGSTVAIYFSNTSSSDTTRIPATAINNFGDGPGVWCINEKKFSVFWCPIKIIRMSHDSAVIAGTEAGALIVSLGAHLLHENDKVRYFTGSGSQL